MKAEQEDSSNVCSKPRAFIILYANQCNTIYANSICKSVQLQSLLSLR